MDVVPISLFILQKDVNTTEKKDKEADLD